MSYNLRSNNRIEMVLSVEMMVMMIPMMFGVVMTTMAIISHSGREFPRQVFFSLSGFRPRGGGGKIMQKSFNSF